MKKNKIVKNVGLLAVLVFSLYSISCTGAISEDEEETKKVEIPEGFVKIKGTKIVGGEKFQTRDKWDFKGAFNEGRTVILSDFYLCDHEVTQKEYEEIIGKNPSGFKDNPAAGEVQENRPVESVSWYDAIVYCNYLSIKEKLEPCYSLSGETNPEKWGPVPEKFNETWNLVDCDFTKEGYRLPTEAEWEYAARGGKKGIEKEIQNRWAGTNDESLLSEYAWFVNNSEEKTHEVKITKPNELELYDMSGNVYEWTWDSTTGGDMSLTTGEYINPTGNQNRQLFRIYKGGYWNNSVPIVFRGVDATRDKVSHRKEESSRNTKISGPSVGFRVARSCK